MSLDNLPDGHPDKPVAQPAVQPAPIEGQPASVTVPPTVTPSEPPVAQPADKDYKGNTVLETSINVFAATTGVTHERFEAAIQNALQYGDENLIDYTSLTNGLTPDQINQAKALAQATYKEVQTQIQSETQAAYQLAGGEAQWKEASQVFNTKAPDHVKAAVRSLLEAGNIRSAAQLVLDTTRSLGMVNTGGSPIQGGNGTAQQGLSLSEFNAQVRDLERSAGNRSFEQGEYKTKLDNLLALRNLGRSQGR